MITKKDVKHIAALARIKLTAEEENKMGKELSAILGFVKKLNEVDTTDIKPLSGGTNLENITRPDEQVEKSLQNEQAEILVAAPEKKDGWVKVHPVRNFK